MGSRIGDIKGEIINKVKYIEEKQILIKIYQYIKIIKKE